MCRSFQIRGEPFFVAEIQYCRCIVVPGCIRSWKRYGVLILSRYIGSSNKWPNATASRYVSDANANSPKKAGMRKKRGAEGSSSLSCTVKKCGKTKQTVYTATVFYNNRKMIGSRTNARPQGVSVAPPLSPLWSEDTGTAGAAEETDETEDDGDFDERFSSV